MPRNPALRALPSLRPPPRSRRRPGRAPPPPARPTCACPTSGRRRPRSAPSSPAPPRRGRPVGTDAPSTPRARARRAPRLTKRRGARARERAISRGRARAGQAGAASRAPGTTPAGHPPALSPLTFRTGRGGPQSASKPQVTPNVPRRRRSAGGGRESSPRAATQPRACAVRPQPRRAGGPGGESAVGRAGAAGWGAPWAPCAWGAKAGPQPRRRTSVARGSRRTAAPLSAHTLPAGRACAPPALQASGMW